VTTKQKSAGIIGTTRLWVVEEHLARDQKCHVVAPAKQAGPLSSACGMPRQMSRARITAPRASQRFGARGSFREPYASQQGCEHSALDFRPRVSPSSRNGVEWTS